MQIAITLNWQEKSGRHSIFEMFKDEKEAYKWLLDVADGIAVKEAEYLASEKDRSL